MLIEALERLNPGRKMKKSDLSNAIQCMMDLTITDILMEPSGRAVTKIESERLALLKIVGGMKLTLSNDTRLAVQTKLLATIKSTQLEGRQLVHYEGAPTDTYYDLADSYQHPCQEDITLLRALIPARSGALLEDVGRQLIPTRVENYLQRTR